MRTYNRNVRRAWDGDNYHVSKKQRLDDTAQLSSHRAHPKFASQTAGIVIEDNLERAIRETSVAALSSSPSRKNSMFSSNGNQDLIEPETLTPPSSPPRILDITPPVVQARKPTFSSLQQKKFKEKAKAKAAKRKRDEGYYSASTDLEVIRDVSEPLSEVTVDSVRPRPASNLSNTHQEPSAPTFPRLVPSRSLTQSVLDFGQSNTPITCTQCQMSYSTSSTEDTTLHNMYHNRHNQGIELGRAFMKSAMKWCYEVAHIPGSVVVVDRKISLPGRRTVQKVLEVVNRELGSVEISEPDLWGQKTLDGEAEDTKKVDNYKVFLHVLDGRCVAVCLVERISKAYKVVSGVRVASQVSARKEEIPILTPTSSSSAFSPSVSCADLVLDEKPTAVIAGVSRLWTSKSFRKKGIANNLLDCVTTQFIYGMDIDKEQVAFSQPTDAGAALAKNWFDAETGWCVYREE